MQSKPEKKDSKKQRGRGTTPFKEIRNAHGRVIGGNVTFSLEPAEDLPVLEVNIKNGSPSKSPVNSPENHQRIIEQIKKEEKEIGFHVKNRVDIMLLILIAYYGTGLKVGVKSTEIQHGACEGTKIQRTFLHACHSSIFPNLFDYRDVLEPSEWARKSILHGTPLYDAMNVTVGLPEAVNQFDRRLEGNRGKAGTGELNSNYARRSLEIINLVSQAKIGPIEGLNRFVKVLQDFYADMGKKYVAQKPTALSPLAARKLILDYERDALASILDESQQYVKTDYIEMMLGISNPPSVRILYDPKKIEPNVLYLESPGIEPPSEIGYFIKTEQDEIRGVIKRADLAAETFDTVIECLTAKATGRGVKRELSLEQQRAILAVTQSRGDTPASEKDLLSKKPHLRSRLYQQKFKIIAQQILGDKYSEIPRKLPFKERVVDDREEYLAPVERKRDEKKQERAAQAEIDDPVLLQKVSLLSILTDERDQLKQDLVTNAEKIKPIEKLIADLEMAVSQHKPDIKKNFLKSEDSYVTPKKEKASLSLADYSREWGFNCHDVQRDGSCFFHAVFDQLQRNSSPLLLPGDSSHSLRESAIDYILQHHTEFAGAILGSVHNFILRAGSKTEWADHHLVHALAQAKKLTIVLLRSDSSVHIFRHPESRATVYLAYDVGTHYQSLVKTRPVASHGELNALIAQTTPGEWRLYTKMPVKTALLPSSEPLPVKVEAKREQAPATIPTKSKLGIATENPVKLVSPYIPRLKILTDAKKLVFEKLPWRFSGNKFYSDPYYMGTDYGDEIVKRLREMRKTGLELMLGRLLNINSSKPLGIEEWHIVQHILEYAEPTQDNYSRSLLLGEHTSAELENELIQQIKKFIALPAGFDFLKDVLGCIYFIKVIYEKLPTRYTGIESGNSSPCYLSADRGDDIVSRLSEVEKNCATLIRDFENRLPIIALIVESIFADTVLEWRVINIILEYLDLEPRSTAENIEEQLGIFRQPVAEEKASNATADPVPVRRNLFATISTTSPSEDEELPPDTKRSQPPQQRPASSYSSAAQSSSSSAFFSTAASSSFGSQSQFLPLSSTEFSDSEDDEETSDDELRAIPGS